jgi:dipeptidyl aminopeptidase/acylaminoacyl peptidase
MVPRSIRDGTTIIFAAVADGYTNPQIWVVPADGSAPPRPLTNDASQNYDPEFSPNGRWISILAKVGTHQWQAFVASVSEEMLFGSSDWVPVTPVSDSFFFAFWSAEYTTKYPVGLQDSKDRFATDSL